MTHEVNDLRPQGIKRKLLISVAISVKDAGNYIIGHFPHGAKLLDIFFVPTEALTAAADVLDIGVASAGDTIIDGYSLAVAGSAIGTAVSVFQTKGTNGGLTVLPLATTVFVGSDGGSTNGIGYFVIEYEDQNN